MRKIKSAGKWLLYGFIGVFALFILLFIYLYNVATVEPPLISERNSQVWEREKHPDGLLTIGNSWFRKSESGLYELYVEGDAFERGVINGKLTQELVRRQEAHFNAQIEKMIPSKFYRQFLKYFIGWFNRDLDQSVKEEYRKEIYGVSLAASNEYDYIGSNYQRMLNYHAAHDIGHTLQTMALVGCTSFGTWNTRSADSNLIIGRNFDFYVGDAFAAEKIVAFYHPKEGHRFMTITWGGFTGAVSGMNEKGLTVTINAAKSELPSGSATPVSLIAKEILQYAQNIKEAIQIAQSRNMFVSESFLVGSAADNKAIVIEKTPDSLEVYSTQRDYIISTNHFQSKGLSKTKSNLEQMNESASVYRYQRVMEKLSKRPKNTVGHTIDVLRDQKGLQDADIGMGNEKAINQLIAHHAVVFLPKKGLVWVSTAPWQLGRFMCYDINQVFRLKGKSTNHEIYDSMQTVASDDFLISAGFQNYERLRQYKKTIQEGGTVPPGRIVACNPNYYHAYVLAADMLFNQNKKAEALSYYRKAAKLEIATLKERRHIESRINTCEVEN